MTRSRNTRQDRVAGCAVPSDTRKVQPLASQLISERVLLSVAEVGEGVTVPPAGAARLPMPVVP